MAYGDLAFVHEILSFRVLIEKVLEALGSNGVPQTVQIRQLSRRFERAPSRRAVKGGVRIGVPSNDVGRHSCARDASLTDGETVSLLDKLAGGGADETERGRLVELLKIADRELARARMQTGAGRYL